MQVSPLTLFLITIMAWAAILAQADDNNNDRKQSDPVVVIKGPGVLPGPRTTRTWVDEDLTSCWAGLVRTYGCIPEMYEAVYLQSFDHLNKGCCQNIVDIIDSCWPRMFPKHPQFSPLLKKYCSFVLTTATNSNAPLVVVEDHGKKLPEGRPL